MTQHKIIMSNPLFNIQYGLFVITTCDDGRDNGCISNTVAQVTAQPNRISVALNKGNLTTELIQRSRRFTASILSEAADFELFAAFGMGDTGRTSRLWSLKEGANLTYAAIDAVEAPGQIDVMTMKKALDSFDTIYSQSDLTAFLSKFRQF